MAELLALVVEDNKLLAQVYIDALERINFRSQVVKDGENAIEELTKFTPDLVILDMNLPRVDGMTVYRYIVEQTRLEKVPVIIATANSHMVSTIMSELRDNDLAFVKPVSVAQLLAMVKRLVPAWDQPTEPVETPETTNTTDETQPVTRTSPDNANHGQADNPNTDIKTIISETPATTPARTDKTDGVDDEDKPDAPQNTANINT